MPAKAKLIRKPKVIYRDAKWYCLFYEESMAFEGDSVRHAYQSMSGWVQRNRGGVWRLPGDE